MRLTLTLLGGAGGPMQPSVTLICLEAGSAAFGLVSLPHGLVMSKMLLGASLVRPHQVIFDDLDTERGIKSLTLQPCNPINQTLIANRWCIEQGCIATKLQSR